MSHANCDVFDLEIARLSLTPSCCLREWTSHYRGCYFHCSPGERSHYPAPRKDVPSGKALRLVGRIAGSRSNCVSDLSTPGWVAQSLASLRPGLLRSLRLGAASGCVRSFCRQVVGSYYF